MRPRISPYTGFALCFSSFLAGIGYGVTAPRAPPGFRAAPRAVFAVTAIRLQSRTPSRLRRCALRLRGRLRPAARGGACEATPQLAAAGCAQACRPRRWRFAACTSRRTVHRHAARPPYGASTPRLKHVAASCGKGVLAFRWGVGLARARAQAGAAVARRCRVGHVSFRDRRPVRPCFVVNPGEGTASPWASWPQPSSENNFPAAARLPRGTNSFRFQVLHCVATASGAASPSPAGRITTRTHRRDLVQPERRKHHG